MRRARLLLPLLLVTAIACSTNPATGKREINMVSEGQELAIGQQSHPEILRQFGRYDEKPELARRVEQIGKDIAARSDRPNLPWTFTVLDTPMVNAMALPGGYIYITRGMLERINSDDELAGVLGHEIAHVTARHSAQQITRSQLAQFGMLLGAVVAGPEALQQYGQLAEIGLGLLFQKYSRAQETQADLFGTEYMSQALFNPVGSERMLMTLQRLDKNPTAGIDRYFVSHPDPAKRVQDVRKKITELQAAAPRTVQPPNRERFVRLLDGAITGNSTENIVIKDGTIYDRAHGMILRTPAGWQSSTEPGTLFAMTPANSRTQMQFVAQEIDTKELQGTSVQDAVRRRFQSMGLQYAGAREARLQTGQRFAVDAWTGQTQGGQVGVETTQFPHGDHVAVFMFIAPSLSRSQSPLGDVLQATSIDAARARAVEPPRMRIGTVRSGETWADLARRATGNANDAEAVANINGFDLRQAPTAGLVVKLPQDVVRDS
jgi:predicted Zn-dependent protease